MTLGQPLGRICPVFSPFILPDIVMWALLFSPLCRCGHRGRRYEGICPGAYTETKSGPEPPISSSWGCYHSWWHEDASPALGLFCDLAGVGARNSSQHRAGLPIHTHSPILPPAPSMRSGQPGDHEALSGTETWGSPHHSLSPSLRA